MQKPSGEILATAVEWMKQGREVALATVIQTWGSAPRPVGSKMLIDGDGNFEGSVSGGCVEASVLAEVPDVLGAAKAATLSYQVEDDSAFKAGLACGGAIRILLEPLAGSGCEAMGAVLRSLTCELEARRPAALLTELASGRRRLLRRPLDTSEAIMQPVADALRRDKSTLIESEGGELFIDVFNPKLRIIVIGAVHIAQAMLPLTKALGQDLVIIDPREAFASKERFDDATLLADWPEAVLPRIGMDERTAVVALAHEPRIDDFALIEGLTKGALYVGALGSKKTHAARVQRLLAAGVPLDAITRIHAPIGLDLGAQGPSEIALSIIAEIVAVERGKGSNRA